MSDLAAWLLEQIDTDEQHADVYHECNCEWLLDDVDPEPCDCGYPARVLAECAAKRRIIACALEDCPGGYADGIGFALDCIAAVYADRPGYDPSWAPSGTIPT